jgi:hypothetical protein
MEDSPFEVQNSRLLSIIYQMDPKANITATWTAYPSLLASFPVERRVFLEAAAEARTCGRPTEAHKTFKDSLPEPRSNALLALEYADLLTDQGLEGDRATFLEEAIHVLELPEGSNKRRLLDLMLADAQFWAHGSLRNAVQVARDSRSWLGGDHTKPLDDLRVRLNGIHVIC